MTILRRYLLSGVLVTIPLLVTLLLLRWLFSALDSVLQPLFRVTVGWTLPGLGLAAGTLLILLAGIVAENVVGRRIIYLGERMMLRLPLARTIYAATKQISDVLIGPRRQSFQRVVLVQWPRVGAFTIGFVTREFATAEHGRVLNIFIISAPNPTTGFLVIVPEADAESLDLTVEQGMMLMLSGGIAGVMDAVARCVVKRPEAS